jgi:hypothetical protein
MTVSDNESPESITKPVPTIGGNGGGERVFVDAIREPKATTLGPTLRITSDRFTPTGCPSNYRMSIEKFPLHAAKSPIAVIREYELHFG